ncbi:S8 family peptidase [Cohnella sp. 56]|uniref:S8 family peptidase n=1 Tax=Cohnella sp. 56 TaxID=3113722 RepID=UPI0030E77FEA
MKRKIREVARQLRKVQTGEGPRSVRSLIVLKHRKGYDSCLRQLRAAGIRPVKTVRGCRMIGCSAPRSTDWTALAKHPDVAYIETDRRAKIHGKPASAAANGLRRGAARRKRSESARPNGPERVHHKRRESANANRLACAPHKGRAPGCPGIPWNISRVLAPPLWNRTKGACARLAVIDTGISPNPDLSIAGGVNTLGGRSFKDDNGHGTHVAGIAAATGHKRIFGVAPKVKLYAVKALDEFGTGFVSDIAEGIDWCIANRMQVINMSFGLPGGSRVLRDAVARARRAGIVMTASAGNDGPDNPRIDAPARYPGVLGIAATTRRNRPASFSSRGAGIALAAPGVNILSTAPGRGYARMSGTSMSSPHAAGGAALIRALAPRLPASCVARRLKSAARPLSGGRRAVGRGLLQIAPAAAGLRCEQRRRSRE